MQKNVVATWYNTWYNMIIPYEVDFSILEGTHRKKKRVANASKGFREQTLWVKSLSQYSQIVFRSSYEHSLRKAAFSTDS